MRTLLIILIVAVVACIGLQIYQIKTDPVRQIVNNLLGPDGLPGAKKSANEASAISLLRTISTVNEIYKSQHQVYALTLDQLEGLPPLSIREEKTEHNSVKLTIGSRNGYVFHYVSAGKTRFFLHATPAEPENGDRNFYINQEGEIRWARVPDIATEDSPTL